MVLKEKLKKAFFGASRALGRDIKSAARFSGRSLVSGSKVIGKGIVKGAKVSGQFAVKKAGESIKEQFKFQRRKREVIRQERLRAIRSNVRASLAPPKQTQQIQPQPIQTFPNLLGSNDNKKKAIRFF